jgi:hypothetical protein
MGIPACSAPASAPHTRGGMVQPAATRRPTSPPRGVFRLIVLGGYAVGHCRRIRHTISAVNPKIERIACIRGSGTGLTVISNVKLAIAMKSRVGGLVALPFKVSNSVQGVRSRNQKEGLIE